MGHRDKALGFTEDDVKFYDAFATNESAVGELTENLWQNLTVGTSVAAWQARRDNLQAKVNWQFTTTDARVKLKRLYPTTSS